MNMNMNMNMSILILYMKKNKVLLFSIFSFLFFFIIFSILYEQFNNMTIVNYVRMRNNEEDLCLKEIDYIKYKFYEDYLKKIYQKKQLEEELRKLKFEDKNQLQELQEEISETDYKEFENNFINKNYNWTCNGFIIFIIVFSVLFLIPFYVIIYLIMGIIIQKDLGIGNFNNPKNHKKRCNGFTPGMMLYFSFIFLSVHFIYVEIKKIFYEHGDEYRKKTRCRGKVN